ncbi:MAG: divalent-cation tolerance protein CutA [Betaproteobacteria bacterium]|nr:divalent-cation tolerance protein CutA [Betaproteobacteria bacterium]
MNHALLVVTNLPDRASDESLARQLVEQRLAACVNILTGCRSVYRWQEKLEEAEEVPVLIKTTQERLDAVQAFICAQHPYELPEIIAVPITAGLPDYLRWIDQQVAT